MRRRNRARRSTSGFSLLETMIALGILAVGLLGVAAAMISAMHVSTQSRERTQASYLAAQQLETFRFTSEAGLLATLAAGPNDPGNPIVPDPASPNINFNRTWLIEPDTPENGVFTLTVFVSWLDPRGVVRTTQLRTLLAAG